MPNVPNADTEVEHRRANLINSDEGAGRTRQYIAKHACDDAEAFFHRRLVPFASPLPSPLSGDQAMCFTG